LGVELQALSPREIQARVRAGASVEQVISETGWPADKVERYAEPPLRERAYIVELAQRAEVRGPSGTHTLGELVADTWRGAQWDAYRTEDGRWRVIASSERERATWIYEPAGRSVHAVDDRAAGLIGREPTGQTSTPASAPVPEPGRQTAAEAEVAVERPRLVSVPDPTPPAPQPDSPPQREETARPGKKTKRGRARVPSWDEILFGATRSDD
jgi:hypothetical protein